MNPPTLDAAAAPQRILASPHAAVGAVFFELGLCAGLWAGASADILLRTRVEPAGFGVALMLSAVAYLAAMSSGGLVSRRWSLRRILLAVTPLQAAATADLLISPSAPWLFGGLIAFGFCTGLLDVTMNTEGTRVEHDLGRAILVGLHARASLGIALGAILGSLIAVGLGEWASALIAAAAGLGATSIAAVATPDRGLDHASAAPGEGAVLFSRALIVIGLTLGASMAGEAAATTWSATLLRHEAPQLAAIVGLGAGFFAGCQALLRFFADRPRRIFGDRRMIIVSLTVAGIGFLIVAAGLGFAASVLGFAVIGFGTGTIVPCGFALAVKHSRFSHSAALSTVALCTAVPRIPAPLAMGAISNSFSIAASFGLFVVLFAAAVAAMFVFIEPDAA